MNYELLCISFLIFLFFLILVLILSKKINEFFDIYKVKFYREYISTLEYYMNMAFDIIYKDQIMIYSIEATSPTELLLKKAVKDYLNLTLSFLGPGLIKRYEDFYGDFDSLLLNITEYFNSRYENDEIKKVSINDMMSKDIDTED